MTRTYNDDGTLATEALTTNGQSYTVGYGYDDANRNTSITYPDGKGVARAYTDRNELQNVKYDNSDVITRSYDDGRRLSSTTYGNGLVESRSYITNDNLIASLGIPSVTGFGYSWDANKNKTAETDGILANYSWSTGANGYDDIDRLIGWSRTNGDSQSWSLSKVGDWDSTTVNGTAETRTHNAVHELTQRGTNALAYDLKGNLTRNAGDTVDRYVWDYDNKLKGADTDQDGAADAVYAYDALGRRVSKTIASTSTSTVYVSALNQEIAEYPAGAAASAPTYDYVFGDYVDEVLLRVTAATGTRHYYHQDSLYCVRAITDANGAVVERYVYDPYGKAIYLSGTGTLLTPQASSIGNTILYTGRRLDSETSLYYYRARYQDPTLGCFISKDPLRYLDGSSQYAYVVGRPFIYTDWSGYVAEPSIPLCFGYGKSVDLTDKQLDEWMKKYVKALNDALLKCGKMGVKIPVATVVSNDKKNTIDDSDLKDHQHPGQDNKDRDYLSGLIDKVSDGGNKNCIKVFLTSEQLGTTEVGWGMENGGIAMNPQPGLEGTENWNSLAHEIGHCSGYSCGNASPEQGGKSHSKDRDNIMFPGDDKFPVPQHPDPCWCKKVAELANKRAG